MGKYFGTDGIRGRFSDGLDCGLAYRVGAALVGYFGKGSYLIGRDTRVSGPKLLSALASGISDCGGDVITCGILPTPAIAYLTKKHSCVCGIMVSASHNPANYNGIKIFDSSGVKLSEEQEGSVEYYIDNPSYKQVKKGELTNLEAAKQEYISYIVEISNASLKGLKVRLDCGYGAASTVAKEIFLSCGADVESENDSLRGEKINAGCGALYPDYVLNSIEGTETMLGFSFDGDADRLSVVLDGEVIDGDTVLYSLSQNIPLKDGVVVGTVLSNLALEKALEKKGLRLIRTPVGDKYICDLMFKKGYNLGGEQSGHYIVYPQASTGDGILSAVFFAKSIYENQKMKKLEKLALLPQRAISEFAEPSIMYNKDLIALIKKSEEQLSANGRLIVRMSGTEPKIRIMVESETVQMVDNILTEFKEFFQKNV